jgi:hypothetical protein
VRLEKLGWFGDFIDELPFLLLLFFGTGKEQDRARICQEATG